jgi:ubiquinone/menaquinone biosynthesis C-methylase UbiE
MSRANRLESLQSVYDNRAPTYDKAVGFHASQAADYLKWMSLKPGNNVLDLACGTGAITVPAKNAVGPSGTIVGVDISGVSLSIARAKAEKLGLDMKFLQHDISSLNSVEGVAEGFFDVITSASALVLLEDPDSAVRQWAKLLKKGGRVIFDVPTGDSMIQGLVLDRVAQKMGVPVVYNRTRFFSAVSVEQLLTDAGLDAGESFMTGNYGKVGELDAEKAREIFDEMVAENKWFEGWYKELSRESGRGASREIFRREMREIAGEDGKINEYMRFHMAVGKKV